MDNAVSFTPEKGIVNPTCWSSELKFQDISDERLESVSGDFQQLLDAPLAEYLRREDVSPIASAPTAGIAEMVQRITDKLGEDDLAGLPADLAEHLG